MVSEKIKILLIKRKMTISSLAEKINTSSANLSNKFKRDNFSENEIKEIAEALDCKFDVTFTMNDTGEII